MAKRRAARNRAARNRATARQASKAAKITEKESKGVILEHYYASLIAGIMAGMIVYLAVVLRDAPYRSYAEAFFIHLLVMLVIIGLGVFGAWTVVKFHQRKA